MYVATLELRSVGNRPNIIPEVKWSHMMSDDLEARVENNQLPYSYIAMTQILAGITAVMKPVDTMVEAMLPDDADDAARMLDAAAEFNEQPPKKVN